MKISHTVRTFLLISISAFAIGLFVHLASEVREASQGLHELIGQLDSYIVELSRAIRSPYLTKFASAVTELGSATVLTIVIAVAGLFFWLRRQMRSLILLLISGAVASLLPKILKSHYVRERPDSAFRLVEADGFSFPSGHALASTTIYATLAFLIVQGLARRSERCIVIGVSALLILGIGWSRVYLGVHYFSDVLGGTFIGISAASLLAAASRYAKEQEGKTDAE